MAKRKLEISSKKPFERHFQTFMYEWHRVARVFDDFLELTMLSFLNNNVYSKQDWKYEEREEKYLKIIDRYKKWDCYKRFPEMLSDLCELMERWWHYGVDYLWHFFENNVTFWENWQFFTPKHITDMMVEMNPPHPKATVVDPACGSWRFLLSSLEKERDVILYGCDLDWRCVSMTTINLFLSWAKKAYTFHMNSLSMEIYRWYYFWMWWWCVPFMVELTAEQAKKILTKERKEQMKEAKEMKQTSFL